MPDIITPNGFIKPTASSSGWDTKLNSNFDIFDTLYSRVAFLEALHVGGGIANYWPIAPGSTWTEVLSNIADAGTVANATPFTRQIVVLPNENINVSSHVQLPANITLCGSGPLSKLTYTANVNDAFGGSVGIRTAVGNIIRDFTIKHDRAAMGS